MSATRWWTAADTGTAVALAAVSQLEIWWPRAMPGVSEVVGNRPLLAATALVATLPLALRRRRPITVLLAVIGALSLQQLLTTPTEGLVLLIAAMVAAYSSSAYSGLGQAGLAGAVIIGGAALMGEDASDWVFIAIVLGASWLGGVIVMQRSTDLLVA